MVVVAGTAAWVSFRLYTDIQLEDALITYRYAQHLARGDGFVFNPDERVLGTTTPLFTILLALSATIAGSEMVPLASNVLMVLAGVAAGIFTCLALEALGVAPVLALLGTAALLLHPDMLWMTVGGMETPLVLLGMAASLWALATDRTSWAAVFAGFLALTRIDGILWVAGVLAGIFWQKRAALLRALAILAAVVLPWLVFASVYFGSPIPHSVIAKRAIGHEYDVTSVSHFLDHVAWSGPFLAWPVPFAPPLGYALFAVGALTAVVHRSPPALYLLATFPLLFSSALYAGRAPLGFDWYLAPIGFASLLVGVVGLQVGARAILRARPRGVRLLRPIAAGAAVIYFGSLAMMGGHAAHARRNDQINEDGLRRFAGEWLRQNTPPDTVVATEAIGYQGYYSDRNIIDLAGLVSPAVVDIRRRTGSNAETFYQVLRDLRPDVVILRSFEVDGNAHFHGGYLFETRDHAAFFERQYREIRRFEAPLSALWGDKCCLTVFGRRRQPDSSSTAPGQRRRPS
jgi:hypothetical protein